MTGHWWRQTQLIEMHKNLIMSKIKGISFINLNKLHLIGYFIVIELNNMAANWNFVVFLIPFCRMSVTCHVFFAARFFFVVVVVVVSLVLFPADTFVKEQARPLVVVERTTMWRETVEKERKKKKRCPKIVYFIPKESKKWVTLSLGKKKKVPAVQNIWKI